MAAATVTTTTERSAVLADILAYLGLLTDGAARLGMAPPPGWATRSVEGVVLAVGRAWTPARRPRGIRLGTPKQCYRNAWRLGALRDLRYVEGFALGPDSPLPVLHAWGVDADDRVVDTTFRHPERSAYYGVVIPDDVARRMMLATEVFGFLGSDWRVGHPCCRLGRIPTEAELTAAIEAHRRPEQAV